MIELVDEDVESVDSATEHGPDIEREYLDPRLLVGVDWNPNEMDDKEYLLLKRKIKKLGFIDSPTVAEVTGDDGAVYYEIVSGHHRVRAAIEVGLAKIPVDVLQADHWQDEDLRKLQNVTSNVLHGKMNPEKFVKIYEEMATKYGKDKVTEEMGYAKEDGVKRMIKQVADSMKESMTPDMAEQFQEQAKEARTISDLERIIQQMFQEHGDTMRYSFMVFAWGGREHTYIAMSKDTRDSLKKVLGAAKKHEVDINEYMGQALRSLAKDLASNE